MFCSEKLHQLEQGYLQSQQVWPWNKHCQHHLNTHEDLKCRPDVFAKLDSLANFSSHKGVPWVWLQKQQTVITIKQCQLNKPLVFHFSGELVGKVVGFSDLSSCLLSHCFFRQKTLIHTLTHSPLRCLNEFWSNNYKASKVFNVIQNCWKQLCFTITKKVAKWI